MGPARILVLIVRQRIRGGLARAAHRWALRPDLVSPSVHEGGRLWEYAVLVTDMAYPIEAIGYLTPLYGKTPVFKKLIANVGAA